MRTMTSRTRLGVASLTTLAAFALFQAPLQAQASVGVDGTFHIHGGTVVVGDGQVLEDAAVLIQDGRIAGIGENATPPADVTHIDATGKYVYAGMINAYTSIGLTEIGRINTMNMQSELGEFNPHLRAIVAINTASEMIGVTRFTGVLSAITAPSGGLVSGQAALINMDGWTWEDMAVRTNAGYVINYPSARGGGGGSEHGMGRPAPEPPVDERLKTLRSELGMAKAYNLAREGGLTEEDLVYESMRPMMRGEIPAIIRANSADDIESVIALGEEFGFEVVVYGGRDAWKVRDELAEAGVPVILSSIQSLPGRNMPYDAVYAQPGVLVDAGVKIAFSTGSASGARQLPYHAALATAYGLSAEDAWKALTIWPAEIFGADDVIGTVEEGKMANLFVADGDPLDIRTNVTELFIKGRSVPFDDRATRLYKKHNARPIGGGR